MTGQITTTADLLLEGDQDDDLDGPEDHYRRKNVRLQSSLHLCQKKLHTFSLKRTRCHFPVVMML